MSLKTLTEVVNGIRALDIGTASAKLLTYLAAAPKPGATVRGAAVDLGLSKPGVTRAMQALAERGLASRTPDARPPFGLHDPHPGRRQTGREARQADQLIGIIRMARAPKSDKRAARVAESPPTTGERLRSLVQRVERLAEEKTALASDIGDIYKEAKSAGFDTKVLRLLIRRRQRDPNDVETEEELLNTYETALESAGNNSRAAVSVEEDV